MIKKSQIQNNLAQIDRLHRQYMGDKMVGLYYSKLAILEVCGWVEESMDNIAQGCAKKHLKETKNLKFVENLVKHTYGFHYEDNFRDMLIQIIGIIKLEILEQIIDQYKFTQMTSSLGALKQRRDELAHTYIKGTTPTIDAPSLTKNRFLNVYEGLKDIESCINKMKIRNYRW